MDDNKNNSVEPGGALIPALRGRSRRNRSWKPAWTIQKIQGSPVLYETLSQKNQFYPNFTQSWLICSKKSTRGCLCGIITLTLSDGKKDAFLTSTVVIYKLVVGVVFLNASHRTLKKKDVFLSPRVAYSEPRTERWNSAGEWGLVCPCREESADTCETLWRVACAHLLVKHRAQRSTQTQGAGVYQRLRRLTHWCLNLVFPKCLHPPGV